jgi:hypothetical protein
MENPEFLSEKLQAQIAENEILRESYSSMAQAILAFDDSGWNTANASGSGDGFTLNELKDAAKRIREQTEGNPLLKRGCGLRTSYIFGRGVSFSDQPPRVQKFIQDPRNQEVVFSPEAQVINERANFTDGQFFLLANVSTKQFQRIPFAEISAIVTDPDDAERIRYIRRTWTNKVQELSSGAAKETIKQVWYPVDTYSPENGRFVASIQGDPVDVKFVMFNFHVNRRVGQVLGVPDAFPALPWAHAYNEYLKDGSRMLKALSMFAWQLKSKTKTGATNAAATIATPKTAGSVAVTGSDMELNAMPRGNNINLTDGRPLGSMVASALEVSVVALLSDPGTSGAYGTAQTLDVPTVKAMESRQHSWTLFYKRVLSFLGAKDDALEINWPKIETEPSQRMTQALALAYEGKAIWQDEYRAAIIEVLDVPRLHLDPPPVDGSNDSNADNSASAVPGQGNSGAVGSMQDNANDQRDADNAPVA